MTLHYQEIEGGGLRAAYLVEPKGDFEALDALVRGALDMRHTQPSGALEIAASLPADYILDGSRDRIYHTARAVVIDTQYTVYVRKDGQRVAVGIQTKLPFDGDLKAWVESVIVPNLSSKGLVPTDSRREQIPDALLRPH